MKTSKVLIVVGIVLILVQLISIIGMSNAKVGLFPENDDLLYPHYSSQKLTLNSQVLLHAVQAGYDRFTTSFTDFAYDKYDHSKFNPDDYKIMTVTQITSAMIRSDLSKADLLVYDTFLAISYSFVGIVGVILLLALLIIHLVNRQKAEKEASEKYTYLRSTGLPSGIISNCMFYEHSNKPLESYLDSCVKKELITKEQRDILFNAYKS